MRVISAAEIDEVLDFPSLIDALAEAFVGGFAAPPRHHHALGPASFTHLVMPAWTTGGGGFVGDKIVNVFPDNGKIGRPAVSGLYILQSGETGEPLAAIDGTRLTHWRTAAASGLAARFLARLQRAAAADGRGRRAGPLSRARPSRGAADQRSGDLEPQSFER